MEHYCGFLVECSDDCDTENFFMFLDHLDVVVVAVVLKKRQFDSLVCL